MHNKKKMKTENLILRYISLLLAFIINLTIFYSSYFYIPTKKKTNKNNLFKGNNIVISQSETDKICKELYKELQFTFPNDNYDAYVDEYLVLDAIVKNEDFNHNLNFICSNVYEILRDNPYLTKEDVYSALLNVSIKYKHKPIFVKDGVGGVYYEKFNSIGIFADEPALTILLHEIIHSIFYNEKTKNLPRFFVEGMTELLSNEYTSKNPFIENESYYFEIAAVKMLCEITSSDTVLKAFTLGDMNYIFDEMERNGISKEKSEKAIQMLGEALDNYQDKKDLKYNIKEFYIECLSVLETCIEIKHHSDISNTISYYYNENLFYNCLFKDGAKERYNLDIERYGVDYKAYFSLDLKTKVIYGSYEQEENNMKNNMLILFKE